MVFRRIEAWLQPILADLRFSGSHAPTTTFIVLSVIHLCTWVIASLAAEERRLRSLQKAVARPWTDNATRPPVQSPSVKSLVDLADQLLVNRPYRGAQWESEWIDEGLALCIELEELERQGRLSERDIAISRRFVDAYLHVHPGPMNTPRMEGRFAGGAGPGP